MRPRRGTRRGRRIGRFLILVAVLWIGSWAAYHGTSYWPKSGERRDQAKPAAKPAPIAMASKIDPKLQLNLVDGVGEDLMLLAGTKKSVKIAKPSKHPTTTEPAKPAVVETASDAKALEIIDQVKQFKGQGKLIAARTVVADYLREHFADPSSAPVRDAALELGRETVLSAKVFDDDPVCQAHAIEAGQTLERLARKNKIPAPFLAKVNEITDPRRLLEGQRIKLPKGPIHLKVLAGELRIYVFLQDVLFARYDVCLGKNGKTPFGKWLIVDKIRRPEYVDPDTGKVYKPSDPENPTGGFWVRLKGTEGGSVGKTGFGIHGTIEPNTIGTFASKGCIRLRNEEMAVLYDYLTPGASEVQTLP